jgi:hypothetical protein
MLCHRALKIAWAILPLAVACAWAPPAAAQSQGSSCSVNNSTAPGTAASSGMNLICTSGTWQYVPYQLGSTTAACSGGLAGELQWTGSAFAGCNGTNWGGLDTGTVALSSLLAAASTDIFDSATWAQTWEWGTLSTQTGLTLTTSSMTTGTLLSLSNLSTTSASGTVLSVVNGEAGASYGIEVTNSSTSNTGYAGYFANMATSEVNYALYASSTSKTLDGCGGNNCNYAAYFDGNVLMIGTSLIDFNNGAGQIGYSTGAFPGVVFQAASTNNLVLLTLNTSASYQFLTDSTTAMSLTNTGLGIGTAAPAQKLEVNGELQVDSWASGTANSLCLSTSNAVATCSSSIRYKENIKDAPFGVKDVMDMRPVTFKWKGRNERDIGFIAEEMQKINPLFVTYARGQIEGVKYPQLTVVLVDAVQEQQAEIDALREKIDALKKRAADTGAKRDGGTVMPPFLCEDPAPPALLYQ